jgi:hypothetical protein
MPKLLRMILSIIAVALSVFGLITENNVIPYLLLLLGASMLITGLIELQKDKKGFWGYIGIAGSLFLFFVVIQGFLLK